MDGKPAAEINVTPQLVRALLAEQHSQFAALPITLAGEGWDNFTFRLGHNLAVRLPRRQEAVQLLVNEQRWLPQLAARLPLRVPSPVAVGEPGEDFPWPWSVVPWIDGVPVDQALLAESEGQVLARCLVALHAPASPDAPHNAFRGVPLQGMAERVRGMLDRLEIASDLVTSSIVDAFEEALAAPAHEGPLLWIHGDLHARNALCVEERLTSFIDWGDVAAGDPAVDLCAVWGLLGSSRARAEALELYGAGDALRARARGWAVLFGATLYENGRINDQRHAGIGEATLRRLADDL